MPTKTIEVQCNARPTRLAFIISKPDRDQLNAIFARASTLWGGVFNPIVILDDSTRKTAGVHYTAIPVEPYLKLQADLLRAFDPDLLITYTNDALPSELKPWQHRCFPSAGLDWNPWGRNVQSYFVDIFPPLTELWEKEFKGFNDPRVKVRYIERSRAESSIFLAARFGLYASDEYYHFLQRMFKAEPIVYDATFCSTHWPADFHTILSLTSYSCRTSRQRHPSHAFFLLDPDDPFDIVDYWNLRASGMYVFPLALDNYRDCAVPIRDFGAASSYPINEIVRNMPTVIKAASISDEQQEEVRKWITEQRLVGEISMQGWVPHYGSKGYGVGNELDIEQVTSNERTAIGVLVDGHGKVEGPVPAFLTGDNVSEHWSMDLDFFTFGSPDACYDMPWLNWGCDAFASRRIGMGFRMDASRVSKTGLVAHLDGCSGGIRVSQATAEDVVKAFLLGVGIEYLETSSPGLALKRIIEMMESFFTCEMFRNGAIRQTLEELATGDHRLARVVKRSVMNSLRDHRHFGEPATQQQKAERAERLLAQAVDAGVFRVGLVFQCSKCRRHHWYAITQFDNDYTCKSCFSREATPRLDSTEWHYASDGLFRSANKLDGNLTVILTLAFFDEIFDHDLKFAPSFNYKLDGPHEMDFAIVAKGRSRGEVEMIFGESKSGTSLGDEERRKLKTFGEKTGSYVCFCTLADDFSADDKTFFMELYESGVKLILLTRFFLEMDAYDVSRYKGEHRRAFGSTKSDWLMRTTIIRTLGSEFARRQYIWI